MANKVLEKIAKSNDTQSGYAVPDYEVVDGQVVNGPVSSSEFMTKAGFIRAFTLNMVLVAFFSAVGWRYSQFAMIAIVVGIPLVLIGSFKPTTTPIVGPLYAITQGLAVGAISKFYEAAYSGIVIQAMVLTITILTVVTFLHQSGVIKVTDRFIRTIAFATIGIAIFYMLNLVMSLFGKSMPLIWDSGMLGVGFSLVVTFLAVSNFLVDLEFVDRSERNRAPKYFESALAFGMTVSVIWVYLEILRLLAKMRD